jgi:hypothetical protein
MQNDERARAIHVGAAPDGTLTYLVDLPPEALPPVRLRDLAAAWEAARATAIAAGENPTGGGWGAARLFRFRRADGTHTDLALADQDACCWAGAVDGTVGMHTSYGLSLCLRLLALVDLLARARWAAGLFTLRPDGAEIHPTVLRTAARLPLTQEARFDESGFRAQVLNPPLAAPFSPGASA